MYQIGKSYWGKLSDVWYQKIFFKPDGLPTYTYYYKNKHGNPNTVCEIDIPISRQLCAYKLIEKDIRETLSFHNELLKIIDEPNSQILVKALVKSVVITYGKCFVQADGRKIKLSKDIIPTQYKNVHEDLINMRHEYIAHAGSSKLEKCSFVFLIPSEKIYRRGQMGEASVVTELYQYIYDSSFFETYKPLVSEIHKKVNEKILSLTEKLSKEIEMVPPNDFYRLTTGNESRITLRDKD